MEFLKSILRAGCSDAGAERPHVVESAKSGKPPPAEPREARREGAGGAQRRATRFAAGENHPPPLRETCRGNMTLPPKIFPRNASCPPRGRGNERFLLSFNGRTRSARLPALSVTRFAREINSKNFSDISHAGWETRVSSCPHSDFFVIRPAWAETCNIR